jgi:hypothetical protein
MVKTLPYYDASIHGYGLEGFFNYIQILANNWPIPIFLFVMYGLSLYMLITKTEYRTGGIIAFTSLAFFLLAMIAQTFATFNEAVIFFFAIATLAGAVISRLEA